MKNFNEILDEVFEKEAALWHFYNESRFLKCLVNTKGYFVHVNNAFKINLGYLFNELTECPFIDFVHPEDVTKTLNAYQENGQGQNPLVMEFENRYRHKEGHYVTLIWTVDDMQHNGISLATARIK